MILKRQPNVRVSWARCGAVDRNARRVIVDLPEVEADVSFAYATLIRAGGSRYSYFKHDEWRPFAHEIKSLESAIAVRQSSLIGAG